MITHLKLITSKRFRNPAAAILFLALSFSKLALADLTVNSRHEQILETQLLDLISLIENGEITAAISKSELLVKRYPGSNIAQLVYADMQNTQAMRAVSMAPTENYSRHLLEILSEIKSRQQLAASAIPTTALPDNIIKAAPDTQHIIAVDLGKSRLYLLERNTHNGDFALKQHYYVSIGLGGAGKGLEGDLRTPIGIYNINGFRGDEKLPELYGVGAFTLDFPNALDKVKGISGSGVWLHGIPHDQLSRPPQDSEGCVVMSNAVIETLFKTITPSSTPVILADSLNWRSNQQPPIANNLLQHLEVSSEHTDTLHDVYSYPHALSQDSTSILYRVRFLHDKSHTEPDKHQFRTQFWQQDSSGNWILVLDDRQ